MTVVGATGYIGKAVVREAVRRGYATTAVARDVAKARSEPKFEGATLAQADVCDPQSLSAPGGPFEKGKVDVVISCLASRTGSKKDSFAIDYQATLNCLDAARAAGARHFVLLSAFCVKSAEMNDPNALQFQYAKKDFEEKLRAQEDVSYSIVRATAFFKSVSGQLEVVNKGSPFVYFDLGEGKSATCNPISEPDLAAALIDTISDKSKENALCLSTVTKVSWSRQSWPPNPNPNPNPNPDPDPNPSPSPSPSPNLNPNPNPGALDPWSWPKVASPCKYGLLRWTLVRTVATVLCYHRWNLGGPDEGLSMRQQGEMLADVLDKEEAKLLGVR